MKRLAAAILSIALALGSPAWADDTRITPTKDPGGAIVPVASAALESSHVLKGSAGNLYGFQVNFGTCGSPPCWIMLFDATSLPANGAVTPIKWYQVGANTTATITWEPGPALRFNNGLVVGCSTTGPFTLTATAQCAISGEVY